MRELISEAKIFH